MDPYSHSSVLFQFITRNKQRALVHVHASCMWDLDGSNLKRMLRLAISNQNFLGGSRVVIGNTVVILLPKCSVVFSASFRFIFNLDLLVVDSFVKVIHHLLTFKIPKGGFC